MINKTNLKIISIIILVSIGLGVIYNLFSADGIPFIREPLKVKSVDMNSVKNESTDLRGLNLANTLGLFEQGNAIFIDARDQWEYGEGHIKGAINIPEFSFSPDDEQLSLLEKENILIIYCSGDDCEISKRLAAELQKLDYNNTFIFLGGFSEWDGAGLPVEKDDTIE